MSRPHAAAWMQGQIFEATAGYRDRKFAVEQNVVVIPGTLTPTGVIAAWKLRPDFGQRLFPVDTLEVTVKFLKDLKAMFPYVPMIAAGGVNERASFSFIAAGAIALGVGGGLIPREAIRTPARSHCRTRAQVPRVGEDARPPAEQGKTRHGALCGSTSGDAVGEYSDLRCHANVDDAFLLTLFFVDGFPRHDSCRSSTFGFGHIIGLSLIGVWCALAIPHRWIHFLRASAARTRNQAPGSGAPN